MSKQIEDEFNLPRLSDALNAQVEENPLLETSTPNSEVESIANALRGVNPADLKPIDVMGTDDHIAETNDIFSEAMKAYKDLLDLGYNIESKHAGANAFQPAAKMLEIALKASQSKVTKKMERLKAIMEKEAHDRDMNTYQEDGVIEGEGEASFMAFRKDLIEKIRKGEI